MRTPLIKAIISPFTLAVLLTIGCGPEEANNASTPSENIMNSPTAAQTVEAGSSVDYTFSGLDNAQAYRITLVVDGNITVDGNAGTFVDNDENGAADAGASENTALIVSVNGTSQTGAKTVPAGTDDPASPSGVFPSNGEITLTLQGVAEGSIYPVLYHNGGASTFLEIGDDGTPSETHYVGSQLNVMGGVLTEAPLPAPSTKQTIAAGVTASYTVTGLLDDQAYRITLVAKDNVTVSGLTGTFIDNDENGAADAGASENTALIVSVNGTSQTGAKTVPAGTDDPASPSGVFPTNGEITFDVEGVAAGSVYPVIYHNGGASTFLEIGSAGVPSETYVVAAEVEVQ